MNNKEYLRQKCFEGLERRGFLENFEYVKRLNDELSIVFSGDLEDFFLIPLSSPLLSLKLAHCIAFCNTICNAYLLSFMHYYE